MKRKNENQIPLYSTLLLAIADLWEEGKGNGTHDNPPAPILIESERNKKATSSVLKESARHLQLPNTISAVAT